MIAHDRGVYGFGCINRQVEVACQYTHTFYVIRMVVCNQHGFYLRQRQAIVGEMALKNTYANAHVNDKSESIGI